MNEQTVNKPSLQQISFFTELLIDDKFIYKGNALTRMSQESSEIFRKLYGEGVANISTGKYKYFLALAFSKNWPQLEIELNKITN